MRVLIIDSNVEPRCWGSSNLVGYARLFPGATIHVRRAPHGDLPAGPEGFDRIIASGSATSASEEAPWIDRLLEFIGRAVDQGKPFLGVCFGHQMLARALAGKDSVRRAAIGEHGWAKVEILQPSDLMKGFPREFHTFEAHYDEIAELPSGFRQLARSEACAIQACQLEGHPVYGIQFHPEKSLDEAMSDLAECRAKKAPPRLLHEKRSRELYNPKLSESLFRNFLEL